MSRNLRTLFILLLIAALATAVYFFAHDHQSEALEQPDNQRADSEGPTAPLVRRHPGQDNGTEISNLRAAAIASKDAIRVEGRISIEVVGSPEERIESGQIELRFLAPEGRQEKQRVEFQGATFELFLAEDHLAIFVDALVVDGCRAKVKIKEPWFERQLVIENGLHLQVQLGQLRKVAVLDQKSEAPLIEAAIYENKPVFIRDVNKELATAKVVVSGPSPLAWRAAPESSHLVHVAAPGYVAQPVHIFEDSVYLAPAGQLKVQVEAPWRELSDLGHQVFLRVESATGSRRRGSQFEAELQLINENHRLLEIDGVPAGDVLVELTLGKRGILTDATVEMVAGEATTLLLKSGLDRLRQPTVALTISLTADPEFLTSTAVQSARLMPVEDGHSLCQSSGIVPLKSPLLGFKLGDNHLDFHFGDLLPGGYALRIANESLPVHLPANQSGPLVIILPSRPKLCLRVVDAQGRAVQPRLVALSSEEYLGEIKYSAEQGGFLIPTVCEEVELRRLDGQRSFVWSETISMSPFKGQSHAEVILGEPCSLEVTFKEPLDMTLGARDSLRRVYWSRGLGWLRDAVGQPIRIVGRESIDGGVRLWTVAEGTCTFWLNPSIVVEGERTRKIQLGANLRPQIEFRVVKFRPIGLGR